MKPHKPDLNEKVTIRISRTLKQEMANLCRMHDFDESLVVRTALEAGIQLAREQGMAKMIEKRAQGIVAPKAIRPPKAIAAKNTAKIAPALYTIQRGTGVGWILLDAKGVELARGPLYDMKAKARKLAPVEAISIER